MCNLTVQSLKIHAMQKSLKLCLKHNRCTEKCVKCSDKAGTRVTPRSTEILPAPGSPSHPQEAPFLHTAVVTMSCF